MAFALALASCSSSGGGSASSTSLPPKTIKLQVTIPASLSGVWTGEWHQTSGEAAQGTLRLEWQRVARVMRGRMTITGMPCMDQGDVEGAVTGANLEINTVKNATLATYTGSWSDTTMSGTYTTNCSSATGTWQMTKS